MLVGWLTDWLWGRGGLWSELSSGVWTSRVGWSGLWGGLLWQLWLNLLWLVGFDWGWSGLGGGGVSSGLGSSEPGLDSGGWTSGVSSGGWSGVVSDRWSWSGETGINWGSWSGITTSWSSAEGWSWSGLWHVVLTSGG